MRSAALLLCLPLLLAACGQGAPGTDREALARLEPDITADDIAQHVQVLASDAFEGRAPASEGEKKTLAYLSAQFTAMGLSPANGASFFQDVPLVSITADPTTARARFAKGDEVRDLAYLDDMMIWTKRVRESVDVADSDIVFVGYGINAPEYGWNDYEGVDVHGKTVLILINDPGFATGDPALFNGKAMTYYGRWTYKYEEAARQGAAAAIIIHETEPAAYPW
ncbi:MAG: peptidase M28, partial [Alphaproteobacteria bacterium]